MNEYYNVIMDNGKTIAPIHINWVLPLANELCKERQKERPQYKFWVERSEITLADPIYRPKSIRELS